MDGDAHLHRMLGDDVPAYCEDFEFHFAIDGKVTTWNLKEWKSRMVQLQRVAQYWTLVDDPSLVSESKDVELAIRTTGCARIKTLLLTHVYWA